VFAGVFPIDSSDFPKLEGIDSDCTLEFVTDNIISQNPLRGFVTLALSEAKKLNNHF